MMKKSLLILTILISSFYLQGQNQLPKREFRAAWIATVTNLDWPTTVNLSTDVQKSQLVSLLDMLKSVNMNAAVFQIRSECDAMYESPYDPWSFWLTGQQGKAPSPYYDPLSFAVEEAHKRGIELHAWFNPYRVTRTVGSYGQDSKHVSQKHPEWVLRVNNLQFLDPGIPMVREYVRDVVMDVVNRYDIDGIHFDDYFYPYEGITNQDDASWAAYNRGFNNRSDWRRDNVNLLLKMINDSLQIVRPEVKFGMSPFGIWKSGTPSGIVGLSAYHDIYCDAIAWLHERSIDYLTPQCYWPFGGGQDYKSLTNWWADSVAANERHFYPGQALYRQVNWGVNEMPNQIRHNRGNDKILGSVMFRALNLKDNPKGFTDSLKTNLYKYVSIPPVMEWKGTEAPNAPINLRLERIASTAVTGLVWDKPEVAADGDSGRFYVVYLSDDQNFGEEIISNSANIAELTGKTSFIPENKTGHTGEYYFTVTALDRNNNESSTSNVVELTAPSTPLLAYPGNEELNQKDTTLLTWNYAQYASSYTLQVAKDSLFNTIFISKENLQDSTYKLTGMFGQEKYYWRISAKNIVGQSEYSDTWSFTTGFPIATTLVYPPNQTVNVPEYPEFKWNSVKNADSYRLQVVKSVISWSDNLIILDVKDILDTTYTNPEQFKLGEYYSWRVMAGNDYGYSSPSPIFKFQINTVSGIDEEGFNLPVAYNLYQNYPNPFNPVTQITFDIPEDGFTSLKIFNSLGQQVGQLINKNLTAGKYSFEFNANNLPTGIYIYSLNSNNNRFTKKMVLIK
ncbi:MAG: hypothetical protein CVV23_00795 [Ignavibacteriae bacterium HGW-Ignavibacteriae-2]|jgi:uncharacterized lipoprotein YddW (UPF0748 family)|nr:MAG: hypothetical protein CVV23_00795 [Ignavibacteriae bacterium HGW-Ignavibacteriae-2]